MKLSPIVLKLRAANLTEFDQSIAGSAELATAQADTLEVATAYVIQLLEVAVPNTIEGDVSQRLIEGFGVVVAIRNDLSQADKTGLTAYDKLFNIRRELWNILVGLVLPDDDDGQYNVEGPIYYKGGTLMDINPAWLWYQFEFEFPARLTGAEQTLDLSDLETISTQYVLTPDAQIPLKGAAALPGAITDSDLDQIIDLTENLLAGSFNSGFAAGFDLYEG